VAEVCHLVLMRTVQQIFFFFYKNEYIIKHFSIHFVDFPV